MRAKIVGMAVAGLAAVAIVIPLIAAQQKQQDVKKQRITLAAVPQTVKAAALKAVAGITLADSVEVEVEDGQTVYEFNGTANGEKYEVEVSEDGRILEVESGDDDDDDDDDKDDDDNG